LLSFLARVPPIFVALLKALIPCGAVARGYYLETIAGRKTKIAQSSLFSTSLTILKKLKYMKD
jgi:hypothetical protein